MSGDAALTPIEPTGERFVRTASETEIELEHVHRYQVAAEVCAGKRVLDAASGEGYGAAMLAAAGATVTGVEIDANTVAAARLRYPGVEFLQGDVARLPLPDAQFDVITSFETLEHVPEPEASLDEFRRVLKPDGLLIISTPEKAVYNRHLAEPNPFHVHEMGLEEFRQNLRRRFKNVAFYGQRIVFGSLLIAPLGGRLGASRRTDDGSFVTRNSFDGAMYLIAVCSDQPLPELSQGLYEGGIPQNALSSILGGLEERDRELCALREALVAAHAEFRRVSDERAQLLQAATENMEAYAALSAERAALAASLQALRRRTAGDRRHLETYEEILAMLRDQQAIPDKGVLGDLRTGAGDALLALRRNRIALRAAIRDFLSLRVIRRSRQLVEAYYKRGRTDLEGVDLVRHYFSFGVAERRDPSPWFSNEAYLAAYPQVATQGYNPLAHYLRFGRRHGWVATPVAPMMALAADARSATRRQAAWKVADEPQVTPEQLQPFDVRPDDEAPREAYRGALFLSEHRLLGERPDFAGAVRVLNTREVRTSRTDGGGAPEVSIVVPVHGQLAYTLNCLDALLAHESRYRFEVIVVDDASPDESGDILPQVVGIRYHRQAENGGFIRSCNAGAELAQAPVLVMLNNDTRVVAGWLDELLETLAASPRAGLVGSKLFYPDGSLQESGGIVWRDGSAWNYGRNDDPNRPEYCYARRVDYVSGASIAVRTELWRSLGGFDEHYSPAYCEDSDLAFRIRQAGYETWLQPLSRVIHYEGKTSGTDTSHGVKAYQVSNSQKLLERWRPALVAHRASGEQPWIEKDRGVSGRVLILDESIPTPDQDAGSVTSVKVTQVFQSLGYKVVFAPIDNFLYQRKYTEDLQRIGVECLYAPFNVDLEAHLLEHGSTYDIVHIFRHGVMREAIDLVRLHCPKAMVMFNNMDLHYLRMRRQAEVEGFGDDEASAMKDLELGVMDEADVIFVPSTYEAEVLRAEQVAPPVRVMPFMVDEVAPVTASADSNDVVFLGGFRHPPNVDAVLWFYAEVWPRISSHRPMSRFVIAGSHPPPEILALQSERVVVTGRIDDLRPAFERARAFVAPLRYGAGVKGKIYTAMSFGTPVVTTSVGAEGIGLRAGEDALVADSPEDLAAAVIKVFADQDLERGLREAGPRFVAANATVEAGCRAMAEAIKLRPAAIGKTPA